MYINNKNLFSGVIVLLLLGAVIVGLLFAFGVIYKKTTLPIVYPDDSINWVMNEDSSVLRGSFNDKITLGEDVYITYEINDLKMDNLPIDSCHLLKVENKGLNYDVYEVVASINVFESETNKSYVLTIRLYNNAGLTEQGDVTSGKGFVIEFSDFKLNNNDDTFTQVKIETVKIKSIYQSLTSNDSILK